MLDADLSISPIKEEDHGEPRSGNISEAEIMKDMPEQSQDENWNMNRNESYRMIEQNWDIVLNLTIK